jgi:hypothetical protein
MDTQINLRRFDFTRDSFAFANELIWEYRPDATTGRVEFRPRTPKPGYAHRCFVLTRAARQFLYHAAFDARLSPADEPAFRRKIREVMSRSPRKPCLQGGEVVFPGYADLRGFSAAWEKLLKAECGGAWQSYVLRSHWRMVFPISRAHQARTAARLVAAIKENLSPIIHLVKFPSLTINHGMVLFEAAETPGGVEFSAYDPNDPARPARLAFDRATKTFSLPPNRYWAGGVLDVIEIYQSWLM